MSATKRNRPARKPNGEAEPTEDNSGLPPEVLARFRVHPTKLTRPNVAIVGFTDHRKLALELDDSWELWTLNELHRYEDPKRFHRWFEIHRRKDLEADPEHLKTLGTFDVPVYMHQHWDDIPTSLPFPKEIVEEVTRSSYQTSSISWMTAMALTLGPPEKLIICGVDMAQETEYFEQRACCEYWIGYARGLGVDVSVPETSDLLKAVGQYGFDEMGSGFRAKLKERQAWLHRQDNDWLAQLRGLDAQYKAAKKKMRVEYHAKREEILCNRFQVAGAISDVDYILRSFTIAGDGGDNPSPDRSKDPRTGITPEQAAAAAKAQAGDSIGDPAALPPVMLDVPPPPTDPTQVNTEPAPLEQAA